jgi:hypothetical protein
VKETKYEPKSKDRDLESKMKVTVPNLIRAAGLSAVVAGAIFAAILPIQEVRLRL